MTVEAITGVLQLPVPTFGRGAHAEVRRTFHLGRRSLLGAKAATRRRVRRLRGALRGAVAAYWPLAAALGLTVAVMAPAWLLASLRPLPAPTPRPIVVVSTVTEVCTVVPGSGDLSCYRGEIDHE